MALANACSNQAKSGRDVPCLQSLTISCESRFVRGDLSHTVAFPPGLKVYDLILLSLERP